MGLVEDGMVESTSVSKAVHGSGRIGFGVNPHSSQLNRVNGNWTRNRPNVRFKFVGTGHWFSGLGPSVDFKSHYNVTNSKSHYDVANSKSHYNVANSKSHYDVANSKSHYNVANSNPATVRHYLLSPLLHGISKARYDPASLKAWYDLAPLKARCNMAPFTKLVATRQYFIKSQNHFS